MPIAYRDIALHPVQTMVYLRAVMAQALPHLATASAALCWNDILAFHVIDWAQRTGRRVPEDLSVIGFDDFVAALVAPRLSTVSSRFRERGQAGALTLLDRIEAHRSGRDPQPSPTIHSLFIARDTCMTAHGTASSTGSTT